LVFYQLINKISDSRKKTAQRRNRIVEPMMCGTFMQPSSIPKQQSWPPQGQSSSEDQKKTIRVAKTTNLDRLG